MLTVRTAFHPRGYLISTSVALLIDRARLRYRFQSLSLIFKRFEVPGISGPFHAAQIGKTLPDCWSFLVVRKSDREGSSNVCSVFLPVEKNRQFR
jgi:hypothetical protein